jgi:hypothetical protein
MEVGDEVALYRGALAPRVHEVALAAVVEVDRVDAEPVHLRVALVDEALAFVAEGFEVGRQDDALEDEVTLVPELLRLLGSDERS